MISRIWRDVRRELADSLARRLPLRRMASLCFFLWRSAALYSGTKTRTSRWARCCTSRSDGKPAKDNPWAARSARPQWASLIAKIPKLQRPLLRENVYFPART